MDCGPADRSAAGRHFIPSESGRRKAPPGQYSLTCRGIQATRRRSPQRRTRALRREDFHVNMEQVAKQISRVDGSGFRAPCQITFEDARPDGAGRMPIVPDSARRIRRWWRSRIFGTRIRAACGLSRHALRPPPGAYRRAGRLVHRRRHLTADLRERLQQAYGGVGFAPIAPQEPL